MFKEIVDFIRNQFQSESDFIPLHEPKFLGNERKYVMDTLDSTYVSSVGKYVDRFEEMVRDFTGAKCAIATVNGTAALHMALILCGVKRNDLVITQAFSFVATCNAIAYTGAEPVFVDIDTNTLGMSAKALEAFLESKTKQINGNCFHIETSKRIAACLPMHTFGHPVEIDSIKEICKKYNVLLVEDAAESIGSRYKNQHTGTFGLVGTISLNGNKTITCGGGGVILTNDDRIGMLAKHLTTQAKIPHPWEFNHDAVGYNYRMPNINAALACAQMEMLDSFICSKRKLANNYSNFFFGTRIKFINEPPNAFSNYWLNSILFDDKAERDAFLLYSKEANIMTRPSWILINKLTMFDNCICENLTNSQNISDRLVNIPSSVLV